MKRMNRRKFLSHAKESTKNALLAGAALSILPHRKILGANERVNLALIGCGGRGSLLAYGFCENGAEIAQVCDLSAERRANLAKGLGDTAEKPRTSAHMREVFDNPGIDAVILALPQHWHALATIEACQAGKDVYVEKPHTHNMAEGRVAALAADKYQRIVQVGTQNRSAPYDYAARDYINSGKLGKISLVKVYNLKKGNAFHLGDPGIKPPGFDWDTWLGPAPTRPYHYGRYRRWHSFWDYSGGDFCTDGIHQFDLAMMLLGDPGRPKRVSAMGGRIAHAGDDAETPDVLVANFEFDDFLVAMEHTNYPRYMAKTTTTIRRNDEFPYWTQNSTRIELYGSERMMTIGRHGGGWIVTTSGGKVVEKKYGRPSDYPHQLNFLECIKTRKQPTAHLKVLNASTDMLHMANIAHRVGNDTLRFDAQRGKFIDNSNANDLIRRTYRKQFDLPATV